MPLIGLNHLTTEKTGSHRDTEKNEVKEWSRPMAFLTSTDLPFLCDSVADFAFQFPQVTNMPNAAADIIAAVDHPIKLVSFPLTRLPITFLLLDTNMIMTSKGGASTPLITAVQKSAVTGAIFRKFISIPTRVEAMMIP